MAQDFAKQRQAPPPSRRPPSSRPAARTADSVKSTHWSWFLGGICCGFLIVGIGYLGIIKLDTEITEATQTAAASAAANPNRPTFDFGFYDELANAEIMVNVPPAPGTVAEAAASALANAGTPAVTTNAEPQDPTKYLLQAGSFQDRMDAESRRAKIILLNMSANIVPGVVSGKTWHRVQVGPFLGRSAADTARDLLSENNIDSIPLLMRE
jgi:cell division protein FtsN